MCKDSYWVSSVHQFSISVTNGELPKTSEAMPGKMSHRVWCIPWDFKLQCKKAFTSQLNCLHLHVELSCNKIKVISKRYITTDKSLEFFEAIRLTLFSLN